MLNITKQTTLSCQSIINGTVAAYMSASIAEDGQISSSVSIQNKTLYEANKAECRKDIEEFNALVFDLEDGKE